MDFKQHLRKYAERELELIGFMQSEFGPACLEFLEKCADIVGNDAESMKKICEILPKLIDNKPLSPITEKDFELENFSREGSESGSETLRCTRYPYLYRMPNGKYYDDRAVAFREFNSSETDRLYLYREHNSSKQEVHLPYLPEQKVKILQEEDKSIAIQEQINTSNDIDPEPDYEVE